MNLDEMLGIRFQPVEATGKNVLPLELEVVA
jgi:hypothetical protein